MKVFLTGATGFVGGALCRAFAERGDLVTGLVRNPPAERSGLPENLQWVVGDITRDESWASQIKGHDVVVHAAGRLGAYGVSEEEYRSLHVDGTRRVLQAAAAAGVGRLLYISSPGVLGPTNGAPKTEDAPYSPSNRYERSKAEAEQVVLENAASGLPVVIVRPEFLYGPGDTHVLGLFQAVQKGRFILINGGRSHCHPTYIDDGVTGMLLTLDRGRPGEIYHITGERSLPFREFIGLMAAAMGRAAPRFSLPRPLVYGAAWLFEQIGPLTGYTPPLTRSAVDFFSTSYRFSWQKARDELGYHPQISTAEGLARSVDWYRKSGYLS